VQALRAEVRDRYGAPPAAVEDLLHWAELRARAEAVGVVQVDLSAGNLALRFAPEPAVDPAALPDLLRRWRGSVVTPQGVLRLPVPSEKGPLAALDEALSALEAHPLKGLARAGL
jgi:transcription-repair coupling factor (superfamily II helicase)